MPLDLVFIYFLQKVNVQTGDSSFCNPNLFLKVKTSAKGSPSSDGFLAPVLMPVHCPRMIC